MEPGILAEQVAWPFKQFVVVIVQISNRLLTYSSGNLRVSPAWNPYLKKLKKLKTLRYITILLTEATNPEVIKNGITVVLVNSIATVTSLAIKDNISPNPSAEKYTVRNKIYILTNVKIV